jgi:3-deoxy-D-arabino-heptulosonate 7-phosphate (DAHP) synthase class II
VDGLKDLVAKAQRGEAFVLQGGDCAETFDECTSENIVAKLKILLQMSLVMLYGLKKPVVRVGRMAGQYAKPRSADIETRDGTSLPSFRGDLVNRSGFTAEERIPDPQMILRGYERAALTLNFVRSLIDGGFADLHHPEYWDLNWVGHSPMADEYHAIVASISDSLDFLETIAGQPVHKTRRADIYAAHAFDAMRVAIFVAGEAKSFSPVEIRKILAFGVKEFPGVTGIIQFNDYGDVHHNPIMFIVKDGHVLNYERYIEEEKAKIREKIKKLLEG